MSALTKTAGALLVAVGLTTPAALGQGVPGFYCVWDASNDGAASLEYDPADFGSVIDNGDGSHTYEGGLTSTFWDFSWNLTVDADPFVDAAIQVTNTSNVTSTFSLLMVLPIVPQLPTTLMNGSAGITVTNNGFDDPATISPVAGDSIYSAYVDYVDEFSAPEATLFGGGYSLSAGPLGTESDSDSFGDPIPVGGPAANNNIAIRLEFELTPGDQASISSLFNIIAVPTPGALALLGVAGLAGRRRRRD